VKTFLAAVGTPIALVALYAAMQEPALFLYYAALGLLLWALVASWMWAVCDDRATRAESKLLWREAQDVADMEARLTDPATATTVRVPLVRLRSVPAQREPWPPIARAVEDETTPIHDDTAVDLFMRSVERWGTEAEQ
jgi:hypothetical protein